MKRGPIRLRAQKKLIKVTFGDGTVLCFPSATETFIATLKKIGIEKLQNINLEIGHLPLISRECHEKYKDYMKPLNDGWYVNIQSDSSQKYIQLTSIKNTLGLDFSVEIGPDIKPISNKEQPKVKKRSDNILIKFPDGEFVSGHNSKEAYIQALRKLGLEAIRQKCIEISGKECVTRFNKYSNQQEVEKNAWLTIPNLLKDKIKYLNFIAAKFRISLEISIF